MKKYLAIAVVVLLIAGYFFTRRHSTSVVAPANDANQVTQVANLPTGWKTVSQNDNAIKLQKDVTTSLKPEVVYQKTTSADAKTPAKYVDTLKSGAKSVLPSLVYQTDKRNSLESGYTAVLTGYYLNKGQKIYIDQRLFIQGTTVMTLTGSSDESSVNEVAQVLATLSKEKVGQ